MVSEWRCKRMLMVRNIVRTSATATATATDGPHRSGRRIHNNAMKISAAATGSEIARRSDDSVAAARRIGMSVALAAAYRPS